MSKHPEKMTVHELYERLTMDGIDATKIKEEEIDGSLLWMMVEDFSEFSALFQSAGERLRLKQFVRRNTPVSLASIPSRREKRTVEGAGVKATVSYESPKAGQEDVESDISETSDTDSVAVIGLEGEAATNGRAKIGQKRGGGNIFKNRKLVKLEISLPKRFSRRVTTAIESDNLFGDERLAFIRECVDFIEATNQTPSKEQLNDTAKQLCDRYPALKDQRKSMYWETLKGQISQRFRNKRRKTPATTTHKILLPTKVVLTSSTDEPEVKTSEIEVMEKVKDLQALSKQKSPPAQEVQELLQETRKYRVKWLCSTLSIFDILRKFPILQVPNWLLHEFNKILGDTILDTMTRNWKRVYDQFKLENYSDVPSFKEEKAVLLSIEKNVYHRKTASAVTIEEACGDMTNYFKDKIVEPRLVIFEFDGEIVQQFVCAENEEILEIPSTSLINGMAYLMATYYVYDVGYPKPYQPLLYFIQDFIMDRADGKKRPTRYSAFAARMN